MKQVFHMFFGLTLSILMSSITFAADSKIVLNVKGKKPVVLSSNSRESTCSNHFSSKVNADGSSEVASHLTYWGSGSGGCSVAMTYLSGPLAGHYRNKIEVVAHHDHRTLVHTITDKEFEAAYNAPSGKVTMPTGEVIDLPHNPFKPLEFRTLEGGLIQIWTRELHRFPGYPVEISGVKVIW
jgi:hypothetical protein